MPFATNAYAQLFKHAAKTSPPNLPRLLLGPAFDAGLALTRMDERIRRSPFGAGLLERPQFTDSCASLWIDGELVHLEDLVLHDTTHELTVARDVLRTRRRIAAQTPYWALSAEGIGFDMYPFKSGAMALSLISAS